MTQRPLDRKHRRVGVVLGAGGVLGVAWMAGALAALQDRLDRPLPDLDLVVGTSAGSVLASALRCGVDVREIVAHQRGAVHAALPRIGELDRDSPLPPLPRLRLGSPQLLANLARAPHRVHPWVAASALVPHGRGQHRYVSKLVHSLLAHAGQTEPEVAGRAWPRADTWIIAVDYDSGRRVAFGRTGSPEVSLADAVVASCSIPGWYEPKQIGDRRYVDGGVRSTTSLALLARMDLDEVYVLAPMASHETDNPRHPAWRAERRFRRWVADRLAEEVRTVAATGARVIVLTPGPADLAAMGINLMDPSRRLHVLETALETSPGRWAAAA
ncbi:MAG TPA: patatin-like phospholipase family protein [Micromonosporaceae bacterium]